jgi:uncharacterized protein DUF1629
VTAVYEPRVEEGYEWALLVDSGDYKTLRGLGARNPGDLWRPPWMFLLTADEDGRRRKKADMPWHGSNVLVVTRRAREVLAEVLAEDAEVLPLDCDGGENLWLVNPWRTVDALDVGRSEVRRFSDGGIMNIGRYVFREEMVDGLRCFRIPQEPGMFVTDEVVDAVRDAALRGTTFRRLWRSG